MSPRRRGLGLLFFAFSAASLSPAAAEEPLPNPPAPAEITLVGDAGDAATIREVITELLSRDRIDVSWSVEQQFQPRDIFTHADKDRVAAWIDLSAPVMVRLYFRDAVADRFFIRSVALARGIDEIAKEEIAHIVSTAVLALSQGSGEALTRSEAQQAMHLDARAAQPPTPVKLRLPLRLNLAALAGAQLFAPDLPVVARGTLSLTLGRDPRWHRVGGSFGAWLDLGYQMPRHYQGDSVGADIEAATVRAGLLWEIEHHVLWRFGVGAGADRVHYRPMGDSNHVELASASSFYVPVVALWVGMDLRLRDWLVLSSRASVDAALANVHFDLRDGSGQTTRVLVPYRLRPAVALGLALVF